MTDLGTLGGTSSFAIGLNDAGQVIGHSTTAAGASHAFITGPDGVGLTDLGTLGEASINGAGQVAGGFSAPQGMLHAFITGPNGAGVTDLGTLGGVSSFANGINDTGQVVGDSDTAGGVRHAFITGPNGVGMTDLNSSVDLPDGSVLTAANDINNQGLVVAVSAVPEPASYALMLAGLALAGFMARGKMSEG